MKPFLKIAPLLFLFLSCKSDNNFIRDYMHQNFDDILQQKILVPNNDLIKINNSKYDINSKTKKLLFLGNMDCSPCVIKLKEIQEYLDNNNYLKDNVDVIYLGLGEITDYFKYQIKENDFSFTIYADVNSVFINQNKLYKYTKSTLLLNNKNEIVLTGDILKNKELQNFYKKLILNK